MMKRALHGWLVAWQFMTRLPVPYRGEWSPHVLRAALYAYVPIGLWIGTILTLAAVLASAYLPRPVLDMLILSLWIGLTGGLHLDGWMDVADAAGSQGTMERRHTILKDPHAGSFAVLSLMLLLGWKLVMIDTLLEARLYRPVGEIIAAGLAIPAAARFAALVLMQSVPPFKQEGLGWLWSKQATSKVVLLAALWFLPFILWQPVVLAILVVTVMIVIWYGHWCRKQFGGMNGDLTGALIEGTEAITLTAAVIWIELWG